MRALPWASLPSVLLPFSTLISLLYLYIFYHVKAKSQWCEPFNIDCPYVSMSFSDLPFIPFLCIICVIWPSFNLCFGRALSLPLTLRPCLTLPYSYLLWPYFDLTLTLTLTLPLALLWPYTVTLLWPYDLIPTLLTLTSRWAYFWPPIPLVAAEEMALRKQLDRTEGYLGPKLAALDKAPIQLGQEQKKTERVLSSSLSLILIPKITSLSSCAENPFDTLLRPSRSLSTNNGRGTAPSTSHTNMLFVVLFPPLSLSP